MMKHTAYERGTQAAGLYKKLTKTMRLSNDACISWTQKNGLPKILGRLPVPIAIFCLLITALLCGVVIGSIIVVAAMFIYMLCNITFSGQNDDRSDPSSSYGTEWRDGYEGSGLYTGSSRAGSTSCRVDNYDDEDDEY
ncbi:hypothetical protein [Duffyella gerundensis]|uniref:hypothetical protein n=1 Tax=Duffyella TaxID=3026546 RepID=UPI00165457DC|nr:hypothetical protein [Duffyella gerundensis]